MIEVDSRYAACVLYVDGSDEYIGSREQIDTSAQPDDIFHTVVEGDRIDLIAYRYFGRAELWWIICDYNDIFFPLEIAAGTVLRLPSVEHVEMRVLG
ncbi:MAG: LysM peptidoglycan-binding domain-containing protein [Armatimonadota bacterium]